MGDQTGVVKEGANIVDIQRSASRRVTTAKRLLKNIHNFFGFMGDGKDVLGL